MKLGPSILGTFRVGACISVLLASPLRAKPMPETRQWVIPSGRPDIAGDPNGNAPRKALTDTVWIAEWTFDVGGACSDEGWEKQDLRIFTDGQLYWQIENAYGGIGGIAGNAATVGYSNNSCCQANEGYDNLWYQAIRIEYTGDGLLSFDYLLDSEEAFDFLKVELDSACASFDRSDYDIDPTANPADFRRLEFSASGLDFGGSIVDLPITGFGTSETHCLYIAFFTDGGWSPCDGYLVPPNTLGRGLVIDNLELTGVNTPMSEDFEGSLDGQLSFVNIQLDQPFGLWARTFEHITDNDFCTENRTCAWLFSDDTTPTIWNDPSMSFGPGGYVIRNWLNNAIISPWVSLASTPAALGTVLQCKIFGGNSWSGSRLLFNGSIRGRNDLGCPAPFWGNTPAWLVGTGGEGWDIGWATWGFDMTRGFDAASAEIQVRFRVFDAQLRGASPPSPFTPGPGPFVDHVRIGRRVLNGPLILYPWSGVGVDMEMAWLAQDAFPTNDRFGSAAFSMGADRGDSNLILGDSIVVLVSDSRDAGGVSSVEWYGAIVSGPHAGKAPPPYTVAPNGFFFVPPDSVKDADGVVQEGRWCVDLDDEYFRGGDVLAYYWLARDALGGVTTSPEGIESSPASVEEAELQARGLWEVSFLPTINWDSGYLARIAADAHGKLDPTPEEKASSAQSTCILYNQTVNLRRRSGDTNRTSFMYALDRLGYGDSYDVYDHMGYGSANNNLGGRASVGLAGGYSLIVHDNGTGGRLSDGSDPTSNKIDQGSWYRNWLAGAVGNDSGTATLWVIAANLAEGGELNPLIYETMGVDFRNDVGVDLNPDVEGQGSFTFENGNSSNFSSDWFTIKAGCPRIQKLDGIESSGPALVTHRYRKGGIVAEGATVMNRNETESWNTIFMTFPWFDIVDREGTPNTPAPENQLLNAILNSVLPVGCLQTPDPATDTDGSVQPSDLPRRTVLHQNVPNPFNPATQIRFDLPRRAHVRLDIYTIAGRLVRALVDRTFEAGFHDEVWNGLDDGGRRVSSGVYLYRLETSDFQQTRKLVVMK